MLYKLIAVLCALPVGGWMLIDGIYCLLHGKYIGPEKPGPWSLPLVALGIDPFRLAPLLVVLGTMSLAALALLLAAPAPWAKTAWLAALLMAIASLWYLPVGTALSVVYILALVYGRSHFVPSL